MSKRSPYPRLFIHADNVHSGGGAILLKSIIESKSAIQSHLQLDARMEIGNVQPTQEVKRVLPTILERLKSQYWLSRNVGLNDTVLFFGNLPPLFRLRGRVLVFVQNRYIIDELPLKNFPLKIKLRLMFERIWFRSRSRLVSEFIVQTPSMAVTLKALLRKINVIDAYLPIVKILPLVGYMPERSVDPKHSESTIPKTYDFIYPASGEPHKNHQALIDAFILLAKEEIFPSLALTVDQAIYPAVYLSCKKAKKEFGVNIVNLGFLEHQQLTALYGESSSLIYPSLYESFGIPLIEAKQMGLPIIASELDYVRDSVGPDQTFDPRSAISIARAIKRHLSIEFSSNKLLDGETFLQELISKTNSPVGL